MSNIKCPKCGSIKCEAKDSPNIGFFDILSIFNIFRTSPKEQLGNRLFDSYLERKAKGESDYNTKYKCNQCGHVWKK